MAVGFLRWGVRREGGDVDAVVPAADGLLTPCQSQAGGAGGGEILRVAGDAMSAQ